jgi:uroporphyrinogen-III decarboxylase
MKQIILLCFYIHIVDEESDGEDEGVTVINVVQAHGLQETQLSKKDFMALVKPYLKKVVDKLKEDGKEERVKGFQTGATEMIKFIISKYDEMQFFTGAGYDAEAGLAFAYTMDGEIDPTFLFFNDGMKC